MNNIYKYCVYKFFLCFYIFFSCILYANDFTTFSTDDENEGFLRSMSVTQIQTDVTLERNKRADRPITQQQVSLLRKANTQRNGVYAMLTANLIPIKRMANNRTITGYSMGVGLRSGVVSYLDKNIGIRGYFGIDFTHDKLSMVKEQQENFNGTFLMLSLGLDILVDFFIDKNYKNTLGFFIGLGVGGMMYFDYTTPIVTTGGTTSNMILTGNIMVQGGLSATFLYRNRIELGVRFLPTQSLTLDGDGIVADYFFYAGYSYKF